MANLQSLIEQHKFKIVMDKKKPTAYISARMNFEISNNALLK